jgi:hypothetical protein
MHQQRPGQDVGQTAAVFLAIGDGGKDERFAGQRSSRRQLDGEALPQIPLLQEQLFHEMPHLLSFHVRNFMQVELDQMMPVLSGGETDLGELMKAVEQQLLVVRRSERSHGQDVRGREEGSLIPCDPTAFMLQQAEHRHTRAMSQLRECVADDLDDLHTGIVSVEIRPDFTASTCIAGRRTPLGAPAQDFVFQFGKVIRDVAGQLTRNGRVRTQGAADVMMLCCSAVMSIDQAVLGRIQPSA